MRRILRAITASKSTIVKVCKIVLSPFTKLAAKLKTAHHSSTEWAIRRRHRVLYFVMASSPSVLVVGVAVWIAITVRSNADGSQSTMVLISKWLFVVLTVTWLVDCLRDAQTRYRRSVSQQENDD